MSTQLMLELKYIDSTEVTFHLNAKLLSRGAPGSYSDASFLNGMNATFTDVGRKLQEQLETLDGVSVMYGQFGFMVRVPQAFDFIDELWSIMLMVVIALGNDSILFATTFGDDAFAKPEFIRNPERHAFDENINTMLVELRRRNSRAITEAGRTIQELTDIAREAQYR